MSRQVDASYRWTILGVAWVSFSTVYISRFNLSVLAPFIIPDLAITRGEFGLFLTLYFLGSLSFFLPAGWMVDKLGVRITLITGELIVGLSTVL